MKLTALFSVLLGANLLADPPRLQPIMAQTDEVVLCADFSKSAPLKMTEWAPRQGTRGEVVDGVLRGRESSPEFQAKKKGHRGLEPRISSPLTPAEVVAQFSVRFVNGSETAVVPFVEFGYHIVRLRFSTKLGLELLADDETTRVAHAPDFKSEPGKWYHVLAELKGDEFVVQFADGPTLHAKHECFATAAPSGGIGLGLAWTAGWQRGA